MIHVKKESIYPKLGQISPKSLIFLTFVVMRVIFGQIKRYNQGLGSIKLISRSKRRVFKLAGF